MTLTLSIAGAIVVLAAAWVPIRNLFRLIGKVTRFIDEVVGEPAQFGRPARPGAIERMDRTERAVAEQADMLREIHHEVHPNSGLSMRDAIDRLEVSNADAAELARTVKSDLADHTVKVWDQLNEHNQAITTLAEAVKVAALSTPPTNES